MPRAPGVSLKPHAGSAIKRSNDHTARAQEVKTWNSETWPAGQPVFAVKFSLRYRVVVLVKVIVTVFPVDGLKVYAAEPTMVLNVVPSVLPRTERVCVRVAQDVDGGRSRTMRATALLLPRSTWSHCGNVLFVLSQ